VIACFPGSSVIVALHPPLPQLRLLSFTTGQEKDPPWRCRSSFLRPLFFQVLFFFFFLFFCRSSFSRRDRQISAHANRVGLFFLDSHPPPDPVQTSRLPLFSLRFPPLSDCQDTCFPKAWLPPSSSQSSSLSSPPSVLSLLVYSE